MIMEDAQFWRSFFISVQRVVLALAINLILIVLMAYPLSKTKREFKSRNIYMNIIIFAMLFSGGLIPTYIVIRNLNLLDTIWVLVLPGAVPIFSVILIMNFFSSVYQNPWKKQRLLTVPVHCKYYLKSIFRYLCRLWQQWHCLVL